MDIPKLIEHKKYLKDCQKQLAMHLWNYEKGKNIKIRDTARAGIDDAIYLASQSSNDRSKKRK